MTTKKLATLALLICGCSKSPHQSHHFVSLGIKDLPLILLDQDTGKVCYARTAPGTSEYLDWYAKNVGPITENEPMYCSDVVWRASGQIHSRPPFYFSFNTSATARASAFVISSRFSSSVARMKLRCGSGGWTMDREKTARAFALTPI